MKAPYKHLYALTEIITRQRKKYVTSGSNLRKILSIMVFHKFDNSCLYLTLPQIYESEDQSIQENPKVLQVLNRV